MTYNELDSKYSKNDLIRSLKNGKIYKYSGFLTVMGSIGVDSINGDLIVYRNGILARIIEKGIDESMLHINNVVTTCKRLDCKPSDLLQMNYMEELKKNVIIYH